ncbi:MAG: plasmid pRiA4b ORF-3 family protein [Deltaproteobacteria bacterium]|nr:plasmid pRiA4b ORF-3 family protein [Deltaproteobacteria bacterium]
MKPGNGYQIKITLSTKPPIWRWFLIPGNYNFSDFHRAIQDVMGWDESHLHEFEVINPITGQKEYIGIPEENDDEIISGDKRRVSDIFSMDNCKGKYFYDFGDYWAHLIELEKVFQIERNKKYPICIQGEGTSPPEDCGGLSAYFDLLDYSTKGEYPGDEFPVLWQRHLENSFQAENVYFRKPLTNIASEEECQLWMRKLLQGKICEVELKQDLCAQMPYEDIELLYE